MFKAAIFDLDGVIVDTVPLHFQAWKKMFAEYSIDFTFDDYKAKVDGIPRYDGAKAMLTDLDDSQIEEAGDRKQEFFLELIKKESIPIYNSSIDLIKALKKQSVQIAVASSSKNCKKILKKLGLMNFMDAIVDGNDFKKGKPDPEIFILAAGKLQCAYSECVVFEDATLGVKAAINANMVCVGIDRYNNPKRLSEADLVVDDLSKVDNKILEGLFKK